MHQQGLTIGACVSEVKSLVLAICNAYVIPMHFRGIAILSVSTFQSSLWGNGKH